MDLPRLSESAQILMTGAAADCGRREQFYLGVEHLFVGLGKGTRGPLSQALMRQGVDVEQLWADLMKSAPTFPKRPWGTEILITPRCQEVLKIAAALAATRGAAQVDESHILEAILHEAGSLPVRHLRAAGVRVAELYEALRTSAAPSASVELPALSRFGRDLTARARSGALVPVVGREDELAQLAQILLRRGKSNPVLVGDAGVGKTAIVEGLALRLAADDCPPPLRGSRLIELSMSSIVAGTRYRGDFEERLLEVVREASHERSLILFLDEIHMLVGAGGSTGAMDASNLLKPSLARGEIRCIGATTPEEYHRWIEQDKALERRFEKILVEEPSPAEARLMLESVAGSLAAFHGVEIVPAAIEASLELTVRYVPQRRLPDKAIDALDQTCARVRLNAPAAGRKMVIPRVLSEDTARTVARWTGMPLERISGDEARRLLRLDEDLRRRVIGQDHAVMAVARAVLAGRAGLADPRRPVGVFLFLGPTGVGKTELARGLAEQVFGDPKRLIRFDMSEFTEAHSVAALIGTPPGYVGQEKEGRLVSAVRATPHSVILFDEVEKAHPQVFDLFLQMFDEGRLGDSRGAAADFRHAIIILTSNIDPQPERETHVGFLKEDPGPAELDPRAALAPYLRAELINRIDEVITFRRLTARDVVQILQRQVEELERMVAPRGVRLSLDETVREWLMAQAAPERFGAREIRRVVDRHLRQPLARLLVERGDASGSVRVTLVNGALHLD